jgi:hypothetical protein
VLDAPRAQALEQLARGVTVAVAPGEATGVQG